MDPTWKPFMPLYEAWERGVAALGEAWGKAPALAEVWTQGPWVEALKGGAWAKAPALFALWAKSPAGGAPAEGAAEGASADAVAAPFAAWLQAAALMAPVGAGIAAWMRWKAQSDEAVAQGWTSLGLPTRRDQEQMLHLLRDLQSRVVDLEEKLARLAPAPSGEGV